MNDKKVVGVDFGGTKTRVGLVTSKGEILGKVITLATGSTRKAEDIIATIVEGIERVVMDAGMNIHDIDGIGIGSPGPMDIKNGILVDPPNLPTLHNFPFKQTIENYFNIHVAFNNDANCFVLGETFFGSAKHASIVCGNTLGTGFGCGIVINNKIFEGSTSTAAEVWCSPYAESNFEEYGSGRTITRFYKQITGQSLKAVEVFELAEKGDNDALSTFKLFGQHLGRIMAIMVNFFDPEVYVIGGSVSNAWKYFEKSMLENLKNNINKAPRENIKVVHASLGDNAGMLGAAALIFSELK